MAGKWRGSFPGRDICCGGSNSFYSAVPLLAERKQGELSLRAGGVVSLALQSSLQEHVWQDHTHHCYSFGCFTDHVSC